MVKLFSTIAIVAMTSTAFAALQPQYQSRRTLVQILESPELNEALKDNYTLGISTTDDVNYIVKAKNCEVVVTLGPPEGEVMPGPLQFTIIIASNTCT